MPDQQAMQDALDPTLSNGNAPAPTDAAADAAPAEGLAERAPLDSAAHAIAIDEQSALASTGTFVPGTREQTEDELGADQVAERSDNLTTDRIAQEQIAAERAVWPAEDHAHNIAPSDADSASAEYGWRLGTGDTAIQAADTELHTDTALSAELNEELADTYRHPSQASIAEVLVDDAVPAGPDNISEATLEAPSEEELLRRESEAQMKQVVSGILDDDQADLTEVLAQSSPQELTLLLEDLAQREVNRTNIRRVGQLKKQFDETYAQHLQHLNQQVESGDEGLVEEAKHDKDALSNLSARFSRALVSFNKRRSAFEEQETTQRAQNLEAKRALLDELKAIVSAEDVQAIDKVRGIQAKWRGIGQVPQADVDDLMQTYKAYLDLFYGLREKYNELLEQDRKVNLEEKQKLIQELEALVGLPPSPFLLPGSAAAADQAQAEAEAQAIALHFGIDVGQPEAASDEGDTEAAEAPAAELAATPEAPAPTPEAEKKTARFWQDTAERVKQMHEAWKHIGPVPREWTEPLWNRFKHATDVFYDQRRAFFGLRDEERGANTGRKRELVTQAQQYLSFESPSKEAWMRASQEMQALMEQWKNTGPATQEDGKALFKQFRDAQNTFFKRRAQYFASLNAQRGGMVEQKEALLARAEALEQEPDSPAKAEQFKTLQREWKNTGPDDYKESRKLAKRFRKIADTFFSGLKEQMASQYKEQDDNLARKTALLDQLEGLLAGEPTQEELDPLMAEYEQIGHVPFKQKDRVNARFRKVQDAYYSRFRRAPRRQAAYSTGRPQGDYSTARPQQNRPAPNETANEREQRTIATRMRQLDELIAQYENNVGFITRGKSGDTLRQEMQQKIDTAKAEQDQLKKQLKDLRRQAAQANQPAPAAEASAPEAPAVAEAPADAPAEA